MTIAATSRAYSDNLRKLRRYLNGRGVNMRMTVVDGSPYASTRITVPGLHSDDPIVSVINMEDLNDATGYLEDGGDKAAVSIFSTNKGIDFTAKRAGTEGNKIYVKAQAAGEASAPLSVEIGAYDDLLGTTGHPGKTVILVHLATDENGAALTSGANDAKLVLAAINNAQSVPSGEVIVEMSLPGNGTTDWTATGPTALTGGADFDQGPTAASLVDSNAFGSQHTGSVKYVARKRGADGNSITVEYAADTALAVEVTGTDILVSYVDGETTAQEVVDAVNANPDASALVLASLAPGAAPDDVIDDDQGPTNLTGGLDPGIQLSVASDVKLLVSWYTRDQLDEN